MINRLLIPARTIALGVVLSTACLPAAADSVSDAKLEALQQKLDQSAWFAQFGNRASWGVPYIRYERALLDQTDPYFNEQTFGASYYRSALGVRFDINAKSSIKFEVAHTRNTDDRPGTDYRPSDAEIGLPQQYNEILAQYAVRF